jgi:indolepyruvate ferredoxin oxidoreductase
VRRLERQLIEDHERALRSAGPVAPPTSCEAAVALAQAPLLVRGYEDIKVRSAARYREAVTAAVSELRAVPAD